MFLHTITYPLEFPLNSSATTPSNNLISYNSTIGSTNHKNSSTIQQTSQYITHDNLQYFKIKEKSKFYRGTRLR